MIKVEATVLKEYCDDLREMQDQLGLSQWEQEFLESMRIRGKLEHLSEKQKQTILNLVEKYDL